MEIKTGLRPKEAAEIIGCSEYTIREMARQKRIPSYRVGNRILFTERALIDWITVQERENYKSEVKNNGKH